MSDQDSSSADISGNDKKNKELTTAQVAKLSELKANEILDFKDYGPHIIVVTIDGRKVTVNKNGKA